MSLAAVVVIPARDEAEHLPACLGALSVAIAEVTEPVIVTLVDDASRDATREVARAHAGRLGLDLDVVDGPGEGVGAARRAGMDHAAALLLDAGRRDGLIACTDADTCVAPDWLGQQLQLSATGVEAIAGDIDLNPAALDGLPPEAMQRRAQRATARLERTRLTAPDAEHHHAGGASLAVTADAYLRVGGLEPLNALEDAAFAARLAHHGIPLARPRAVRVHTSARRNGRATHGLAADLDLAAWAAQRRYDATDFEVETLARARTASVSVVIPAKEVATRVGGVLRETVAPLRALVDEVVVVDAGSSDGTAEAAARAGATVVDEDDLLPAFGPCLGKGDAMWRALSVTDGEIVCFLDADTADPHPHHLLGILGPLLADDTLALVKGSFARPRDGVADEGGRVTELLARPLLNLHEPRLAGFTQPLAGEFAARRALLTQLSFPVGYGVEIAVLVDALRTAGLDALAECAVGTRQNRHQSLRALGAMAYAVLAAMERRVDRRLPISGELVLPWDDCRAVDVPVEERPPLASLRAAA